MYAQIDPKLDFKKTVFNHPRRNNIIITAGRAYFDPSPSDFSDCCLKQMKRI